MFYKCFQQSFISLVNNGFFAAAQAAVENK